jgi:hypothetical protein
MYDCIFIQQPQSLFSAASTSHIVRLRHLNVLFFAVSDELLAVLSDLSLGQFEEAESQNNVFVFGGFYAASQFVGEGLIY